jgi:hypothetical protein
VYPLLGGLIPGSSGGGVWLVDIVVLPMGLQTPSAPSVLSLILPLETPHTVQWLAARIELCICKDLAGPLRRQLYQAPFSKHFFFIFLFFFIMYFPQLHFQCYPKSPPYPPPTFLPTHSHFLALAFLCTEAYKVCMSNGPLFPVMAY